MAGETNEGVPPEDPQEDDGLEEQFSASIFDLHDLIKARHFFAKSGYVFEMFRRRVFTTAPILESLIGSLNLRSYPILYLESLFTQVCCINFVD